MAYGFASAVINELHRLLSHRMKRDKNPVYLCSGNGGTGNPPGVFLWEVFMAGHIAAILLVFSMGVFACVSIYLSCFEGRDRR